MSNLAGVLSLRRRSQHRRTSFAEETGETLQILCVSHGKTTALNVHTFLGITISPNSVCFSSVWKTTICGKRLVFILIQMLTHVFQDIAFAKVAHEHGKKVSRNTFMEVC